MGTFQLVPSGIHQGVAHPGGDKLQQFVDRLGVSYQDWINYLSGL